MDNQNGQYDEGFKMVEAALRTSEKRFRSIFENTLNAIAMVGTDKLLEYVNPAFHRMFGLDEDELYYIKISDICHPNDNDFDAIFERLQNRQIEQLKEEKTYLRKDGTLLYAITSFNGIYEKGVLTSIAIFFQDVTEQKLAQNELQQKNIELQQALHELSETQNLLIQQTRFAVAGEVINNIAHQWRQPLHVIALWTDETRLRLEENGINNALYNDAIEHILDTTQSLSHTINDMARLFRSSEPTTRFNICDQIHATLALMCDKFDEAGIRVSCESCEAIEVQNYPNAFSQALMHILNNTVDSLKDGDTEKKIVFTVQRSKEKGRKALITVTDSGKGIDPAIFEKMFEPYTTTKFKHFGTGLSLYISKLIIEKNMQGLLYAQNSKKGASFFIEL